MVEAFVDDHNTRRSLQVCLPRRVLRTLLISFVQSDCLKPMPDFNRLTKRFNRGIASLEDVVRVYQAVSKVRQMVQRRMQLTGVRFSQLPQMIQLLENAQPKDQAQLDLLERTFVAPLRVSMPYEDSGCH
jgi:DNA mismatch repair protein MSH2